MAAEGEFQRKGGKRIETEHASIEDASYEQLKAENQRLREQLAVLAKQTDHDMLSLWYSGLAAGLVLFIVLPIITYAYTCRFDDLNMIAWSFSAPFAQWSILLGIGVLLRRSFRFRLLLFATVSACLIAGWYFAIDLADSGDVEPAMFLGPIAGLLIGLPIAGWRIAKRWRIKHSHDRRIVRPTSIADYLALTFVIGLAAASSRFMPSGLIAGLAEISVDYFVIFCGPLAAAAILLPATIAFLLGTRSLKSPRTWLFYVFWVALGTVVSSLSPYYFALTEKIDPAEFFEFGVVMGLSFAMWFLLMAFWMRCLGYRLNDQSDGPNTSTS